MELYLLYPENKGYLKGEYKRPVNINNPDASIGAAILLSFLAGLLPWCFSLNMLRENILLSQEALIVQGRIINRYIDDDDDGTTYHVVFEYVANDRRYERRQQVGKSEYGRYEQGMTLDIEYSRYDPSVARLAGTNNWDYLFPGVVLTVTFIPFSGVLLVAMVYRGRRWRARLKRGKLLRGKLLKLNAEEGEDDDGGKFICTTAHVAFRAPDGKVVRGKRSRVMYHDGKLPPPPAEASVAIFYMDDDHWEVL